LAKLRDGNLREWQVTMSEGRNRQIRRTFAALGYTVVRLDRTNFGNYSLGDIKRGLYHQINIQ
ncbi:MAG: ribosomal large subunit pseudouridine synthase B, partial [Candidatus Saccharimonas sp.]|nr:ribosomal large subunit pseudouridine synthase B [Candidatus Saccharimonas sp.]